MNKSSISVRPGFSGHSLTAVLEGSLPTRRDLVIGALVSFSVIFGWAEIGQLTKGGKPRPAPKEHAPTIEIVLPKLEPDPPEVVEETVQPMTELPPPMLNDLPQMTKTDAFVQPIQPAPPADVTINEKAISIPANTGNWKSGVQVFDPSQLDQQPVPTVQGQPNYPFEMRRNGVSGQVVVNFIVDVSGQVRSAFATSSSQHEFEAAAVQAVSKWRFHPGRKGGRAVNTRMEVPIVFTLNGD